MTSADPRAMVGAPGKPAECPDCKAPRHRLYLVTRMAVEEMPGQARRITPDECYGCKDCGRRTPWRLATASTLIHLRTAAQDRAAHGPQPDPADPAPPQAQSRDAIRAMLADD